MAFNPVLRRRLLAPAVATACTAGLVLIPKRRLHAESPSEDILSIRKPIYDNPDAAPTTSSTPSTPNSSSTLIPSTFESTSKSSSPTPTDRLAAEVKRTRLFLHRYAVSTEDSLNSLLTSAFKLENSFTQTIASLAPPRESKEQLLPGAIYVLVSAMAGSIITRRSNILLRFFVPVAAGITAGNFFIPITTRNVGQLIWRYEERFPVVADTHRRVQERTERFWETGKAHSAMTLAMAQDKVKEGRDAVEDWVKKGR
ncbi:hypothetical protein EV356DRAFT_532508 [Viridothelium virens]|uniref:MICOS complex subunit n=1 Tax=Viridothelium virens TaxID=1048519 RepID=A0A6A6H9N9_VIRVR|nr:hypothetical protein EV356DRAFT_532508 [Viridothelium virens]